MTAEPATPNPEALPLRDKHVKWLDTHAITPDAAHAAGLYSHPTVDAVMVPWRDGKFPDALVGWIHPDARKVYGKKSLANEGENGLNIARRVNGSVQWFVVEGIGQHLSALSYAMPEWNIVGMNGCDGIHKETDLSWADGAEIVVLWDADRATNERVAGAVNRVITHLVRAGAVSARVADLPAEMIVGPKDGLDDVLARLEVERRTPFIASLLAESVPVGVRERVNVSNPARAAEWLVGELGQHDLAGLFRRGDLLVHTPRIGSRGYVPPNDGDEDGPAQVQPMTTAGLKARVEYAYEIGRNKIVREKGEDGAGIETETERKQWEPRLFPGDAAIHGYEIARQGLAPNLRSLHSITHTPVFRRDGSVLDTRGYDASTRMLYLPDPSLRTYAISNEPTTQEVADAVKLIQYPIKDFPFVEENHRANWIGALFTPILRAMYPGPFPMFIIDAPSPGSGKSYLAKMLRIVHGGILRADFPQNEEELKKGITAILVGTTAPIVQWDNVKGTVRSGVLEGLLTTDTWSDRYLGQSRDVTVPNDRLWLMTANNAMIGGDLARRSVWITIDPKMPRPETRRFDLNPTEWTVEHRGELLAAILTIARAWVVAGKPGVDSGRSDDFGRWMEAIRGILTWAGFPGTFGTQVSEARVESDDDADWGHFLWACYDEFGDTEFTISTLTDRLKAKRIDPITLPGQLADKFGSGRSDDGFRKSLGRWFKNRAGRYSGGYTVEFRADSRRGSKILVVPYVQIDPESLLLSPGGMGVSGGFSQPLGAESSSESEVDHESGSELPTGPTGPQKPPETPKPPTGPAPAPEHDPHVVYHYDYQDPDDAISQLLNRTSYTVSDCWKCGSELVLIDRTWYSCPTCWPVTSRNDTPEER